jgi:hypothetical protein
MFTLILRLCFRIKKRLCGWDDFFIILAAAASFTGDIIVCMSMHLDVLLTDAVD